MSDVAEFVKLSERAAADWRRIDAERRRRLKVVDAALAAVRARATPPGEDRRVADEMQMTLAARYRRLDSGDPLRALAVVAAIDAMGVDGRAALDKLMAGRSPAAALVGGARRDVGLPASLPQGTPEHIVAQVEARAAAAAARLPALEAAAAAAGTAAAEVLIGQARGGADGAAQQFAQCLADAGLAGLGWPIRALAREDAARVATLLDEQEFPDE